MSKILVVDDDMMSQRMAEFMIKKMGYEVLKASSGAECISVLGSDIPDLILLDVEMPGMNGFETLEKIRSMGGALEAVKVMMLSGTMEPTDLATAKSLGAVDYLQKPFIPADFQEKVQAVVEG